VFFTENEPRLRRALVATYGAERGREATAEAFTYAWQHWARIATMERPVGYLYRVGQSRSRPRATAYSFPPVADTSVPWVEPELPGALTSLTERERVVVVLIEGYGWSQRETAELLDISTSSVQTYLERALRKLRTALKVVDDHA
jgi:DNA-directed RNA polymerase specialized sigma24 family protein